MENKTLWDILKEYVPQKQNELKYKRIVDNIKYIDEVLDSKDNKHQEFKNQFFSYTIVDTGPKNYPKTDTRIVIECLGLYSSNINFHDIEQHINITEDEFLEIFNEDELYYIRQLFGVSIQSSEDIYEVLLDKIQDYYITLLKKQYNKTPRDIYNKKYC